MPVLQVSLLIKLPSSNSLKDKRSIIQSLIVKVHQKYNASIAEMDLLEKHRSAFISFALVGNNINYLKKVSLSINVFIEENFKQIDVINTKVEIL